MITLWCGQFLDAQLHLGMHEKDPTTVHWKIDNLDVDLGGALEIVAKPKSHTVLLEEILKIINSIYIHKILQQKTKYLKHGNYLH